MNLWITFWLICLIIAGSAFALITLIVAVKGFKDLREMLKELAHKQHGKIYTDKQDS